MGHTGIAQQAPARLLSPFSLIFLLGSRLTLGPGSTFGSSPVLRWRCWRLSLPAQRGGCVGKRGSAGGMSCSNGIKGTGRVTR